MNQPGSPPIAVPLTDLPQGKVACQDCSLHQLCLPVGIDRKDLHSVTSPDTGQRPDDGRLADAALPRDCELRPHGLSSVAFAR